MKHLREATVRFSILVPGTSQVRGCRSGHDCALRVPWYVWLHSISFECGGGSRSVEQKEHAGPGVLSRDPRVPTTSVFL